MTDLILDLVGSLLMSVYFFFRYDKLIAMHHTAIEDKE